MAEPTFIQTKRADGPPPPPPHHAPPRPPPGAQHHPGQGQGQGHPGPQGQQQHHAMAPPPPREALPLELRIRQPFLDVSDIRQDFPTEDEMRAHCTEYFPIRFEKILDQSKPYDHDHEEQHRSGWERATRTQVQGLTKKEIERDIRRLDRQDGDIVLKKKTLGPALLRQLDKTMFELSMQDHDRANFGWSLAQIDHQLKQVDAKTAMQRDRTPLPKRSSKSRSKSRSKVRKIGAKRYSSSSTPKRYWERISLTAYFKREPRPHVNIPFLFDARKRALEMTQIVRQPAPMPAGPPPEARPAGPPPGAGRGQAPPMPPPPPNTRPSPAGQHPAARGAAKVVVNNKKKGPVYHEDRSSGSESTGSSDDDSWTSGPTRTTTTSESRSSRGSLNDKRGRNANRSRRQSRSHGRENSRHFGIEQPRRHSRHEANYVLDAAARIPLVPAPPPLLQTASASDIERIKEEAYNAGRADERFRKPGSPPLRAVGFRDFVDPDVRPTTISDIERIRDDAYIAGITDARASGNRLAEEFVVEPRPRRLPRALAAPPRHVVRTIEARNMPRDIRRASHLDDELANLDFLSLDEHEYVHERRPRPRYDVPRRNAYDPDSLFDSLEEEDDYDRYEVREIRERPYHGGRRRSEIIRRQDPYRVEFEHESHPMNPFAPRSTRFGRARSFERRP